VVSGEMSRQSSGGGNSGSDSPNFGQYHRDARRGGGLAVKVIRKGQTEGSVPEGASVPSAMDVDKLVMWEVHVLQKLAHPHIVSVMDVIEVVDATYIIMQRVDGPELTEYLSKHPQSRLPPWEAISLFGQLLSALRHAHRRGFLHCDIKPDNVRLSKACDHAVLTDWGYARRPGERSEGYMCGTPAYASPEQLTGYHPDSLTGRRKLCPATDVWSLGVTLFEIVSGALPFVADSHEALVKKVLGTKYLVPDHVPLPLSALVASMLVLAPSDRASIEELCASPYLEGGVPPEPASAAGSSAGGDPFLCGSCEEDGLSGDGKAGRGGGRGGAPFSAMSSLPPWIRRSLWMLLYASLCGMALWSHLAAPGASELEVYHGGDDPD